MPAEESSEASIRSLRRLFKGLERRHGIDGAARIEIDKQLVEAIGEFVDVERKPAVLTLDNPPPRAVAVAMAQALYCQPHLGVIFGDVAPVGTEAFESPAGTEPERPLVMATDCLVESLGLQGWELDDIREDVDRRVGGILKQARALRWLWNHFGLPDASPEPLFRVLFPGAPGRIGALGMVRRGAQLYALVQQDAPPPSEALYLPWLSVDPERGWHPLRTFGGKYVNGNIRRALARGIGAADDEVVTLLDQMITVLPRGGSGTWLARDTWRARGLATLTDLPGAYGANAWLSSPVAPEDVGTSAFLRIDDGKIVVGDARAAFDVLATARIDELMRQLYGEILSRLQHEKPGPAKRSAADLVPIDLERHMRAVLQPLIDWAGSAQTAAYVGQHAGVPAATAAAALAEVKTAWLEQIEAAWVGAPAEGQPRNTQSLIASHLLLVTEGLREVLVREADPRAPHRDTALLFAAFYLGHQPLERLWTEVTESTTWPATARVTDPIGAWFWGTWQRVLASWEDESTNP